MGRKKQRSAMTLVEVLIVVTLIALLSAIIVPIIDMAQKYRENTIVGHKLRTASLAFEMYRSETGGYPPDKTPGVTPPEMIEYFAYFKDATKSEHDRDGDGEYTILDWWTEPTEIGGKWDWDNGYHYAYSVSIAAPTVPSKQLDDLDKMIDDGDRTTGKFRAVGSHHHYILEE